MDFYKEIRKKIEEAEKKEKKGILFVVSYIGSISIIFILPVILGAYIGWFMDGMYNGEGTVSWTITGILIGVMIGIYNVYQVFYKKEIK